MFDSSDEMMFGTYFYTQTQALPLIKKLNFLYINQTEQLIVKLTEN